MEENASILKQIKHEKTNVSSAGDCENGEKQKRQLFLSENDTNKGPVSSEKAVVLQNVSDETLSDKLSAEINGEVTEKSEKCCLQTKHEDDSAGDLAELRPNEEHCTENKENTVEPPPGGTVLCHARADDPRTDDPNEATKEQQSRTSDEEIQQRAREEGRVNVAFPGTVTQDGCCRFVSEILKCVLYQRQQLPMTYDQLVYSQKKQQASVQDSVSRRPAHSADVNFRKCQQTLQELEEVLQQLEVLFSLSRVPRVLLLMGGSLVLPKELYEINMEALLRASGDRSLRVSSCLRQLFRTLFVADLLSDTKPVRLMPTTVLVLAHRDCGVGWFRPKLQFKVPTRVKSKVVALSSDLCSCEDLNRDEPDWDDYIWFQAPTTIKGFSNCKP